MLTDDDIEVIRHDLAILSRFPLVPMPVTRAVGRLAEMVGLLLEERERRRASHEQGQQGQEAEPLARGEGSLSPGQPPDDCGGGGSGDPVGS